jgi:hypothetical protein
MKMILILYLVCFSATVYSQKSVIAVASQQKNHSVALPVDLKNLFSVLFQEQVSGNFLVDEISGNDFTITSKDFVTNFIPSTSTCTISLGDVAALKVDDADGLFYTDAGTSKQVPISYLLNNDYTRTLVKYSDESPYDIQWIGILDDAATPTDDQWNRLHRYFNLHTYWSGVYNDFGYIKDNRSLAGLGYKGWIVKCENELAFTGLATATKKSINKYILDLRNYGVYDGFDRQWLWMLNDALMISTYGTVSIKNYDEARLTFPVAPTYATSGIKGNGSTQYAQGNFNASTDGVNYTLNNASVGTFVYDAGNNSHFMGGPSFFVYITGSNCRLNSGGFPTVNLNGVGYTAASRNAASGAGCLKAYKETTETSLSESSSSISTQITFLQVASNFSTAGESLGFIGRSFTQAEHANIRTAFLAHKTRLGL